jgi:hypothetical protein
VVGKGGRRRTVLIDGGGDLPKSVQAPSIYICCFCGEYYWDPY